MLSEMEWSIAREVFFKEKGKSLAAAHALVRWYNELSSETIRIFSSTNEFAVCLDFVESLEKFFTGAPSKLFMHKKWHSSVNDQTQKRASEKYKK